MDTPDRGRVTEIVLEAARLPLEQLDDFLDRACAGDGNLRAEVESLLSLDAGARDGKVGPPTPGTKPTATESPSLSRARPERIGPYKILDTLGEGGMGVVYLADQEKPIRRRVALKLIKLGMDTRQVMARFESERQALAIMNHPNVAKVFDAGATEQGRPYFVMEYVKGVPVTEHCDRQRLTTRERLELFLQVCEGVQHAHQKGVIHRDIKPSNVLVSIEGDRAIPKIIDFGVAKATQHRLTEATVYTELGQIVGTPEYMSPEQAEMTSQDIDTRTDVYSLGVMLYELLVGALPFDPQELRRAGFDEIRRKIREDEPSKPSTRLSTLGEASAQSARRRRTDPGTLVRQLRRDLDWITMKALEKDRTRRYGSPAELSADLDRHLSDQPVLAGAPSPLYRLRKLASRHRMAILVTVLVVGALVLGTGGTIVNLSRALEAERTARIAAEQAARETVTSRRLAKSLLRLWSDSKQDTTEATPFEVLGLAAERLAIAEGVDPELFVRLGQAATEAGDFKAAKEFFERAARYLESDEDRDGLAARLYLTGLAELLSGEVAGAETMRRAIEVLESRPNAGSDELAALVYITYGQVMSWLGWGDEVHEALAKGIGFYETAKERDAEDFAWALAAQATMWRREGRLEDAEETLRRALLEDPDSIVALLELAMVHAAAGRHEEAQAALAHGMSEVADDDDMLWAACVLVALGDRSRALRVLEQMKVGDEVGLSLLFLRHSPDLAPLRGDARFEAVVERLQQNLE